MGGEETFFFLLPRGLGTRLASSLCHYK